MIIIYIDILLLIILLCLILFMCCYCVCRVHRLRQNGEIAILLKPTKVVFSHKKDGDSTEELRTVVAYQNPLTGDYCIRKSRVSSGYVNNLPPESPDSGVSDEYEPLNLEPMALPPSLPHVKHEKMTMEPVTAPITQLELPDKHPVSSENEDNSVNKTWNWNYKEYQI